MKVCLLTNRLTYHQLPLCLALSSLCDFKMILMEDINEGEEHKYPIVNKYKNFVIKTYEDKGREIAEKLCFECDVLIYGIAPSDIIKKRLKTGKLTFKYSERVYKMKRPWYELPLRAVKYFWQFGRYKNLYLLCASAYVAGDYAKTGTFLNKTFKWGYFPETKKYDIDNLFSKKEEKSILWVGRLIDWKHPEIALEIAKRLVNDGYDFMLNIIGTGDMEEEISNSIQKLGLQKHVKMLGSMSPEEVREYMEKSQIFLMTSDRQEGWGAVLNESMNSGCAVVANSATGSAPYLVNDGENGFLYNENNIDDMYKKVKYILDNPEFAKDMGEKAHYTITEQWNAQNATQRFLKLSKSLLSGKNDKDLFENGVCSFAHPIKDNWYQVKNGDL